jgi:hypothetical protein
MLLEIDQKEKEALKRAIQNIITGTEDMPIEEHTLYKNLSIKLNELS